MQEEQKLHIRRHVRSVPVIPVQRVELPCGQVYHYVVLLVQDFQHLRQ